MPNYLQAGPVCSTPTDVETTITIFVWYWRKLKNVIILKQVLDLKGATFISDV